jgi:hypothetical protein
MQDKPADEVSDEELHALTSILEDIGLREKEVEAYIHRRIWNESLSLVSSKLEIRETTVKTYTSNVQSVIKDVLEAADILEDIEDSGTNLTETPARKEATEAPTGGKVQPQTTTCLIKYNSTQLSHGKVPAESYPFIENISDAGVIRLDRRGNGKDRFAFNLNYYIETDTQIAAQQYAAITAKTFPSHDFAEEFEELVAELAEHAISADGVVVDNVRDLHQFISDALNHLFNSEDSDSSVNLPGNLRHFISRGMDGKIPEIYNETTLGWSSMEFVSDDRFGQITHDLFADPSEKRPFRAAAILASTIGNCLENPLGGPYQIIVQQGPWMIDMSELICQAVSSPAINRIVLINDFGGSQAGNMTRFETGLEMLADDHPNDITIEDDPNCSGGQRKYIEVTEDRIAHGCWNKNIGQHS